MKNIIRPNINIALTGWCARADIPNQVGYKLLVRHANGSEYQTQVIRGTDGLHRLANIAIADVVGWLPLPPRVQLPANEANSEYPCNCDACQHGDGH